jgi:hypothetical protein
MILTDHDLKQIDRDYVEGIAHNKLVEVSLKLLADLKEARDRLNQTSQNSSRPSGSFAPWEGSIASDGSPVEDPPDKEAEEEEKKKKKKRDNRQSKAGEDEPGKKKQGKQKGAKGHAALKNGNRIKLYSKAKNPTLGVLPGCCN